MDEELKKKLGIAPKEYKKENFRGDKRGIKQEEKPHPGKARWDRDDLDSELRESLQDGKIGSGSNGFLSDQRYAIQRKYEVKHLREMHEEICRLLILGFNNQQIAAKVGTTAQMVSNTRNSELGRKRIAELSGQRDADAVQMRKRIDEFADISQDLLEDIIAGKYEEASLAMRAKYADRHLSRAGHGTISKNVGISAHLSGEQIEEIKANAIKAARDGGHIVDVEDDSIPADFEELQ